ncbi:MAG: hypothetical protein AB8B69_19025 [Chitinophagales bacterium]
MMSINTQLLDVLERYVAYELSEKERTDFETRLEKEEEVADALDFFLAFEAEKEDFGRALFKEDLRKIDAEMQLETAPVITVSSLVEGTLERIAAFLDKSIGEVSTWFQPIPEYQALLVGTHRSHTGIWEVAVPTVGADYTNDTLVFEFKEKKEFLLTIENNQRQEFEKTFDFCKTN